MKNNPFNGETFQRIWLKHFQSGSVSKSFKSLKHIKFFKSSKSLAYVNVGKNITNGNYYSIAENETDYKNKVFLVYDVPSYFTVNTNVNSNLKVKKITQYKGFTSQLKEFENFDAFFTSQFNSKSRYKYRRNISRLESCFDIEYKIFHGNISREEYDHICKFLKKNLARRFGSLGLDNNIVSKWDYYYELMYEMILKKEGVLTAIYNENKPIGISFGFLTDDIMLFAITSLDIDYLRYNLGHTNIIKLMTWCIDNGYNVYDFSKGQYAYKDRWTNHDYNFECHILYDSKSLKASAISIYYSNYFKLKQFLRNLNVNRLYAQLKFKFKNKENFDTERYKVVKLEDSEELSIQLTNPIDIEDSQYESVRMALYEFLYVNPEKAKHIKVYQSDKDALFFAVCESSKLKIFKV